MDEEQENLDIDEPEDVEAHELEVEPDELDEGEDEDDVEAHGPTLM